MNTIRLSGYKASPASLRFGTVDSYGVEQMQFVLGDDWKNLAITATFTNPQEKSTTVHVPADTLLIDVPPEATAGESGAGQIAVVGYADGVQVISTKIVYTLQEHAPIEGSTPAEPTPSLLQQVLTATGNAETSAAATKDAAEHAQSSASAAAASAAAATSVVKPFADMAVNAAKEAVSTKDAAQKAATDAASFKQSAADAAKAAQTAQTAAGEQATAAAASATDAAESKETAVTAAENLKDSVAQIAANKAAVSWLKEYTAALKDGKISKFYASSQGNTNLPDSDDGRIMDLKLYGKSSQDGTPTPDNPVEIKSVVNPVVTISDGADNQQTATLPYALNAIPVTSGGNVTIDGQQYIADYVDVERGKLVRMVQGGKLTTVSDVNTSHSKYDEYVFAGNVSGRIFKANTIGLVTFAAFPELVGTTTNASRGFFPASWGVYYLRDKKGIFPQSKDAMQAYLNSNDVNFLLPLITPTETDLTADEIAAFKALVSHYPVTNVSTTSDQLDGYTVFDYPISLANGWNYVKQQIGDTRDYLYGIDLMTAEAYVNSEYAAALAEIEV